VLALLLERPMHGYEIIQELESRTGGIWRPSPGSVYPTLQLLEDEGLIERRAISAVPPWVEYSLTAKGTDLRGAINGIDRWAERWAARQ